ncbi:polyprenyl diphosphate synthase [Sulfurivermis fontis]|uniref:polyprenyl diphosphate synthase n=1 Tax=Sulfurivermis fontis TaxID=1972068 RepID=UPI000FD9D3B0|nr:polyprenyl diphosphate synthase [Sulfurivermis fontis]
MSDSELYARKLPRHVAIIMDGNGRWARKRGLPRFAGHKAGMDSVRAMVKGCLERGIEYLTLFAFSSENWRRPAEEVGLLMNLFMTALDMEVKKLHKHGVRLRIIGDCSAFAPELQKRIAAAEELTSGNTALNLIIAANYGGRWDITQACRFVAEQVARGELAADAITPAVIETHLSLAGLPEPDLFIRTGGEQRISNFLLWQLAYTELYFTPLLWPEFDEQAFAAALESFASRQRRFGRTGEQVEQLLDA